MDLNVLSNGYLKDGEITINGTNFSYSMNMIKDNVLKYNYIANNIKTIELNQVNSGTQKLIIGNVLTNIGNNTNNYSKISSITLTGIHVSDEGVETPIEKTVNITVDWYGTVTASLSPINKTYFYNKLENNYIEFSYNVQDTQRELLLKENVSTVTIPNLNDYSPTEVICTNSNLESEYNSETQTLTIKRSSVCDEDGTITSGLANSNTYTIRATYSQEAFDAINSYTTLTMNATGYYIGYNNQNEEFKNPYQSNIATGKVTVVFMEERPKGIYITSM